MSWGELLDKMTILEIKSERLKDPAARANVAKELALLEAEVAGTLAGNAELQRLKAELRRVNETLWQVEDDIRAKEAQRTYDAAFVELARAVYLRNDERGALKKADQRPARLGAGRGKELQQVLGSAALRHRSRRPRAKPPSYSTDTGFSR